LCAFHAYNLVSHDGAWPQKHFENRKLKPQNNSVWASVMGKDASQDENGQMDVNAIITRTIK
jgi:hypothetical protein